MNGTTVDALAATGTLREVGFEDRQAEAVAGVARLAVRFLGGLFTTGGSIIAVMAALELFG